MKIDARYLLEEPELGDAALPDSLELDLPIDGDRILDEVYLPAGVYEGPHPTVILCHGIPGTNNNDDVAQCLRRMGCVVIRPYHRGAWGSEGIYSFSHCIEDAIALARWAREEVAKAYDIDPKNIFLAGHSNGGNTVLNAARYLPFLRGVIAFCPYDHQAGLEHIPHQDCLRGSRRCAPCGPVRRPVAGQCGARQRMELYRQCPPVPGPEPAAHRRPPGHGGSAGMDDRAPVARAGSHAHPKPS